MDLVLYLPNDGTCKAGAVSVVRLFAATLHDTGPECYRRKHPQEIALAVVDDVGDLVEDLCPHEVNVQFVPADVAYCITAAEPGAVAVCYVVAAALPHPKEPWRWSAPCTRRRARPR